MNLEKRVRSKAPRQKETGSLIGGVKTIFQRSQFYLSLINFLLLLTTAYYTTIRHVIPWLPFEVFLVLLVALLVGLMALEYLVIFPSQVRFQKRQAYLRDPIARDVRKINDRLKNIEKELGIEGEEKKK